MIRNSIPTPHIEATSPDEIANTVLMPGDPLRAKFIADKYLTDVKQFNQVRGMLGFTGYYKGKRVSVMGSGMGIPSAMIYFHELFAFYGVETIIRIGTAGTMQEHIKVKDVVVATAACTNSNINTGRFGPNVTFAPTPDFDLLVKTQAQAKVMGINTHFGVVMSGDSFYDERDETFRNRLKQYGVLAGEMESVGLFSVARKLNKKSLAMFTISDSSHTGEAESALERERGYTQMMELALEVAPE